MVFQQYAMYPHLNVYNNMAFGLRMRRVSKAEIDRRVRDAARQLGIEDLLERRPAALSGGQRQRVALGRAVVRQPQVFLFDEPLSNLDTQLRVSMRNELVNLQRRLKTTMIHVTHDQIEAMTMGGRMAVMNRGRILQTGRPEEVYDRPSNRFVAEFIGSPPMNLLDGTIEMIDGAVCASVSGFAVAFSAAEGKTLAPWIGKPATLGFRPENVETVAGRETDLVRIPAEVVSTQALGVDTLIKLRHGGCEFTASQRARTDLRPGECIDVFIAPAKCHVFDAGDGDAILW
jgi:multiple sugar transport system ATP-binding protein